QESVAVEQPQQAGLIYPAERSIAVAAEEVIWSPAEFRGLHRKSAVEKPARIIYEGLPAAQRYVPGWPAGVEPREAGGPGARDAAVMLDDSGALFLGVATVCQPGGWRRRRWLRRSRDTIDTLRHYCGRGAGMSHCVKSVRRSRRMRVIGLEPSRGC